MFQSQEISYRFTIGLIALSAIALLNGCGRSSSSTPAPAPLTTQQRQDLMTALEGMSAIQVAVPEFGIGSHPSASKPGVQELSSRIRTACLKDAWRQPDKSDVRRIEVKGAGCPVNLYFDLDIQKVGTSERRNVAWSYEVNDESVRALNTIDRLNLTGSQEMNVTSDFQGSATEFSQTIDMRLAGDVHSPQLGAGRIELVGRSNVVFKRDGLRAQGATVARFNFPTFQAEFKVNETVSDSNHVTSYTLNGVRLSESEVREIRARLPRLGLAIDGGAGEY